MVCRGRYSGKHEIHPSVEARASDCNYKCFQKMHGDPVNFGDPRTIGLSKMKKPECGERVEIHRADVRVFWVCGVTATIAALKAGLDLAITHTPGHMFISEIPDTYFEENV